MAMSPFIADLPDRAAISLAGPDWRAFLQGLITQDVETLAPGQARFAALLTPQGRLLFDLFVIGRPDGCLIDCGAGQRDALIQKLTLYRLRAKVEIVAAPTRIAALWGAEVAPAGWTRDPRLPALGFRGYDATPPAAATRVEEPAYEAHRLAMGVPGPGDWGVDRTYPIEANFDLLEGIDFKKGCFIGQETTSRMKRRGLIKTRMAAILFDGPPPPAGSELLAGDLRAGEACSGMDGVAMALLRLDRLEAGPLTLADGRPWRVGHSKVAGLPGS
jgi:folate-binding protein YgfZ